MNQAPFGDALALNPAPESPAAATDSPPVATEQLRRTARYGGTPLSSSRCYDYGEAGSDISREHEKATPNYLYLAVQRAAAVRELASPIADPRLGDLG